MIDVTADRAGGHLGIAVVPESMRAFTISGLVCLDIEDVSAGTNGGWPRASV